MPKRKARNQEFKKMTTTHILHWATRHKNPDPKGVHSRSLSVLSTNVDEAAKVSLCIDLLKGKAPPSIQSSFNDLVKENLETFNEQFPDFVFLEAGRPKIPA